MIDKIISDILLAEGSTYTDRADDRGGPTKYGITLTTLAGWRKHTVTPGDVAALTEAEARDIYLHLYVVLPGFDRITDAQLQELCVDAGVQHGTGKALSWLQTYAGVKPDGVWGHETEAAVARSDARRLRALIVAERIAYYGQIISHDHTQAANASGWANRMVPYVQRLAT